MCQILYNNYYYLFVKNVYIPEIKNEEIKELISSFIIKFSFHFYISPKKILVSETLIFIILLLSKKVFFTLRIYHV